MSHPALTGRWRWLPSRPARKARSAADGAAAGDAAIGGSAAGGSAVGGSAVSRSAAAHDGVAALDVRRRLQLLLAGLWLLDGVLQLQSAMFTRQFPAMLAESAAGQPGAVAGPVTWAARLITEHPAPANAAFAALQIALGLGLAWRPAVRPALAGSVIWGLAVWWLGEGLGGLLTGTASPVDGAPGAALLYAVTAVLLWPPRTEGSTPPGPQATPGQPAPSVGKRLTPAARSDADGDSPAGARANPDEPDLAYQGGAGNRPEAGRGDAQNRPGPGGQDGAVSPRAGSRLTGVASGRGMAGGSGAGYAARLGAAGAGRRAADRQGMPVPFVAGQAIGVRAAAAVWLVLWGGLAALAMQPAVRAPHALSGLLANLAGDAPGWLARADEQASAALGGHGLVASVLLAVLMAAIGVAGCRPDRAPAAARTAVIAAVTFGVMTAAAGGFGELFTGMATDPGTGPILALLALAYWPCRTPQAIAQTEASPANPVASTAPVTTASSAVLTSHAAHITSAPAPASPIPPAPPDAPGTGIAPASSASLSEETAPDPPAGGKGAGQWR
jgi:hypothetical protein